MTISLNQLDPYFQGLIANIMAVERQPLERLQASRDDLDVRRGVYVDANNTLKQLQTSVKALSVSLTSSALTPGRATSVSNAPSGATVLSASASSTAVVGTYDVVVSKLAKAQRRVSAVQSSVDLALGKSGEFWLGGTGTASASVTGNSTVSGVGAAAVASGQKELGAGAYTVETRDVNGTLQFRLKNSDGNVVTIANANGTLTNDWQSLTAGTLDTKRGLTLTLTGAAADATTTVNYTAAGTKVDVAATDTLQTIATNINAATQSEGREIAASLVGKQLVLSAANTGTNHTLIYTDGLSGGGLGFTGVDLQAAQDAEFTVNGLSFVRSINTGLTDVISGVALNLAADAEGKSATLNVTADLTAGRQALTDFIAKFNEAQTYLKEKTNVVVTRSGETVTYSRGALSTDTVFSELRSQMFMLFTGNTSNTGLYQSLREIGLTIDDNLQATLSDSAKLDTALSANLSHTQTLLDAVMTSFNDKLSQFTGSSTGYIDATINHIDARLSETSTSISDWNSRLDAREEFYYRQYGELQAQLIQLTYLKQTITTGYSLLS